MKYVGLAVASVAYSAAEAGDAAAGAPENERTGVPILSPSTATSNFKDLLTFDTITGIHYKAPSEDGDDEVQTPE